MDLQKQYGIVEDAIQTLGLNPEETRCEGSGQWLIERDNIEIYVDVWQPESHNQWEYFKEDEPSALFQVVSPVCHLPTDPAVINKFYEELLYLNHHMFYGSFTVNTEENMVALVYKRLLEGINRVEIIEPVEAIGYYAENLSEFMAKKYGVKKIEKNS